MAVVKIWRCRDHRNGGRFDGSCYLDCNGGITSSTVSAAFRARFRFDPFETGTTRMAVWGAGDATHTDGYMLLIEKSGDDYRPVVRYLNTETTFGDIALRPDTLYSVLIYISFGVLHINVNDRWNNLQWEDSQSVSASGSLSANHLYAGATCNDLGDPELRFTGVIYDLMYAASSGVYVRLVFYEGYGGASSGAVKDAFGNRDATVMNPPADFWPPRTDISDNVTSVSKLRRETDSWGVPTFSSVDIVCLDTVEANPHDVIEIEAVKTSGVNWLYRVQQVEQQTNGLKKLHCVDALADLANVAADGFFSISAAFTTARQDWWSNYAPVTYTGDYSVIEYNYDPSNPERCWVSLGYILQAAVCFLQLDNLLSVDLTGLIDEDSPIADSGSPLDYRWLACNLYELIYAGRSARDDGASMSMDNLLRRLAFITRFTWLVDDSELVFSPMITGINALIDNVVLTGKSVGTVENGPHQLLQKRLAGGVDPWDAWDGSDTEELSWSRLSSSFRAYNQVVDVNLPSLLQVRRHSHINTALNDISPDPMEQLVGLLDDYYGSPREVSSAKVLFIPFHNARHLSKIDDVAAMTTELKQQS